MHLLRSNISFILLLLGLVQTGAGDTTSAFQFYNSEGTIETAKFGWTGDVFNGRFFIQTPNDGDTSITVKQGVLTAKRFVGDGSSLTGIEADSIPWSNIKDIPTGFADGVDNEGTADSTNFAHYADSSRTVTNGSIISAKIADGAVTDVKIDSVSWNKIKGIPAGFADGVDNEGTGTGQWTKVDNDIYYNVINGNVGVGVNDSVSSKLTVGGTVKAAWEANQDRYVEIYNNGIGNIHTPNNLKITSDGEYVDISDNTNTIRLKEGKLSIGTLDHQGFDLCVEGTAYCTSGSWSGSDKRWKKNIKPIDNALQDVLSMEGVQYDWRKEEFPEKGFPQGKQVGLIAQDVEETLPEVVATNPNGYKSISYEKIVPVLIEAIKEQNKRIELLEEELKNIKSNERR